MRPYSGAALASAYGIIRERSAYVSPQRVAAATFGGVELLARARWPYDIWASDRVFVNVGRQNPERKRRAHAL